MIKIVLDLLRLVSGKGKFNMKHAVNDTYNEELEIDAGIFGSIVKTLLSEN